MLPKEKTKKSKIFNRQNTILYGLPKVGKSTFAAQIPNALFLATEAGHNHLEVFKIDIASWQDVLNVGKELQTTDHGFECIVIDVVDWFYKHCESYVCKKNNVSHPADLEFGKGWSLVKDEFVRVINGFNQLGHGIVFVAHSKEREIKKKSIKYSYMDTSLGGTINTLVCGLCDFIFYAYIDEDGKRILRTKPTKYINAGDRSGRLPELMAFDYNEVAKELEKIYEDKP